MDTNSPPFAILPLRVSDSRRVIGSKSDTACTVTPLFVFANELRKCDILN